MHLKRIRMIAAMYVSSVDLLSKNLAWWAVMCRTSKNVKIGGWGLAWGWVIVWDNMVLTNQENTINLD